MSLGWKLKQIHEAIQRQANSDLQEMDLTLSQHHALLYLSAREDHTADLKELERHFCVAQATMAGIAQRLESKGYVEALQHPTDKRIKLIRLTEQGLVLSRRAVDKLKAHGAQMVAGLTDAEQAELERLLGVVYRNLQDEESSKDPEGERSRDR